MPCNPFYDYVTTTIPTAPATLAGTELIPLTSGGVVRRATSAKVAQAATNWSTSHNYNEGTVVVASDDNQYIAISPNNGQDPILGDNSYWALYRVRYNTTLAVPTVFPTIPAALDWLSTADIDELATVTITVANDTYALTTTQLNLNHPQGSRIRLIGNVTTPASCVLTFTALPSPPTGELSFDSGSIYINGGHNFGEIDGFTINKAGGAAVFGHCAILAYNASIVVGKNMVINGFWAQLASAKGGSVLAIGTTADSVALATTTATSYTLYSDSGFIDATYADISTVATSIAVGLRRGGEVILQNADLSTTNAATTYIYEIVQAGTVDETSTTYGSFANFAFVEGRLQFGPKVVVASSEIFATRALITNFEFQAEGVAKTEALQSTSITTATLAATTSFTLGTTAVHTGIQGGAVTLDAAGDGLVLAAWVTANTIITPTGGLGAAGMGTMYVNAINAGVSFIISSSAGAADVGLIANWSAIVYP